MIARSVLLRCSPEAAFRLFTERIDAWWPPERRHAGPGSSIVLGPDRFAEFDGAGREVPLGRVCAWEPPVRLALEWYPGTGPSQPTAVEVLFRAEPGGTRVEVRHQPGAAGPTAFGERAPRYLASWDLVLAALARSG